MGKERTRCRTACICHKHRGLNFHEAAARKEIADGGDHLRTLHEGILHLGIHDEVGVALTIAHVRVGDAVELLRKHLKALGEERHLRGMHGNLTGHGAEHIALDAVDIADVGLLKISVRLIADAVLGDVNLHRTLEVLQVAEGSLAHDTLEHQTSRDGDLNRLRIHDGAALLVVRLLHSACLSLVKAVGVRRRASRELLRLQCLVQSLHLIGVMGLVILCDGERVLARRLQVRKLLSADLQKFTHVLRGFDVAVFVVLLCHGYPPVTLQSSLQPYAFC